MMAYKMPAHGLGEKVILGFCLLLLCSFLMLTVTDSVVVRLPGPGLVKSTARAPVGRTRRMTPDVIAQCVHKRFWRYQANTAGPHYTLGVQGEQRQTPMHILHMIKVWVIGSVHRSRCIDLTQCYGYVEGYL